MIDGGKATLVTYRSVTRIHEMPNWRAVLELFRGGVVDARLATIPISRSVASLGEGGLLISDATVFGTSRSEEAFPDHLPR